MGTLTFCNFQHAVNVQNVGASMNKGSGRIRATTEVNFKTRMEAFVFGEHEDIWNPGDLMIVMSEEGPGDRLGKNVKKFEIQIAGDQLDHLLKQVTRAKELYEQNVEWLKTPITTPATTSHIAVDEERLARHLHDMKTGGVPRLVG